MRIKKSKIAHSSDFVSGPDKSTEIFHDVFGTVEGSTRRPTDHADESTTRWPFQPNFNTNVLELDTDSVSNITLQHVGRMEPEKPTGHIECMLEVMNFMFVSPYRRDEYKKRRTLNQFLMLVRFGCITEN